MKAAWNFQAFYFSIIVELLLGLKTSAKTYYDPFTCSGKVIGGYYADLQENCQMFHVCTIANEGEIRDIVFRCLNGTVFDQETRVCEREEEVDCSKSESFYDLNNSLYGPGIIPEVPNDPVTFKTPIPILGPLETLMGGPIVPSGPPVKDPYSDGAPFTVTRTASSSSVSSSANVHIETPISRFTLRQGIDRSQPALPAPHLRPSLLKLAAAKSAAEQKRKTRSISPLLLPTSNKMNTFYRASPELDSTTAEKVCKVFHMMQIANKKVSRRRLRCSQNGFDPETGRCLPIKAIEEKMFYDPSFLCSLHGSAVVDLRSNCKRYFDCSQATVSAVKCPEGKLFSQKDGKCISSRNLTCKQSRQFLVRHLKSSLKELCIYKAKQKLKRNRRALSLEDNNSHREASHDSLTNAAEIFSDHVSVIDAHSSAGKFIPDFRRFEVEEKRTSKKPRLPPISIFNKTSRNGTVFEVREFPAPDQRGKVTITSVVPKSVIQNGNNQNVNINTKGSKKSVTTESELNVTINHLTTTKKSNDTTITIPDFVSELTTTEQPVEIQETTMLPEEETTIYIETTLNTTTSVATTTTSLPDLINNSSQSEIETNNTSESDITEDTVSTNFTCKDKVLEQFYPDIENNCRLFHYCSPGFSEDEVLDLNFVCSGETRFDIITKKCEAEENVVCGEVTTALPVQPTTTKAISSETSISSTDQPSQTENLTKSTENVSKPLGTENSTDPLETDDVTTSFLNNNEIHSETTENGLSSFTIESETSSTTYFLPFDETNDLGKGDDTGEDYLAEERTPFSSDMLSATEAFIADESTTSGDQTSTGDILEVLTTTQIYKPEDASVATEGNELPLNSTAKADTLLTNIAISDSHSSP